MKRKILFFVLYVLFLGGVFVVGWLVFSQEESIENNQEGTLVKKVELPLGLGEVVLKPKSLVKDAETVERAMEIDKESQFAQKVTEFIRPSEQRKDAMILSRGISDDGIERVQLRGQVVS